MPAVTIFGVNAEELKQIVVVEARFGAPDTTTSVEESPVTMRTLKPASTAFFGIIALLALSVWFGMTRNGSHVREEPRESAGERTNHRNKRRLNKALNGKLYDQDELDSMKCMRGPWNMCVTNGQVRRRVRRAGRER